MRILMTILAMGVLFIPSNSRGDCTSSCNRLWNIRVHHDDIGPDNNAWIRPWRSDYDDGFGRWVEGYSGDIPWSQTFLQGSGQWQDLNWLIDPNGALRIRGVTDYQWHAWTWCYVEEARIVELKRVGDCAVKAFVDLAFDSPIDFPATLALESGWNRIDLTGYNQNDSYDFRIKTSLADLVDTMNGKPEPRIIYVDVDASGANDGSGWADAFNHLQDALTCVKESCGYVTEIRVAAGTYWPDSTSIYPNGTREREATFQLINGVTIKGGYAGFGEPDPNERNFKLYETILSGDLDGNDLDVNEPSELLDDPTRAENSIHVVTGSGTDSTAVLDGFIISGGNANLHGDDRDGGGMFNDYGSPTIINCVFMDNSCDGDGGGMFNDYGSPTITNCVFIDNSCYSDGGAMHNKYSSSDVTNCKFQHNFARYDGGGMHNRYSDPSITACTFSENVAGHFGGAGMHNLYSSPTVVNCNFLKNGNESGGGGGVRNEYDCNPTFTNCVFTNNSAGNGGGMHNHYGVPSPTLTGCTFTENFAKSGGSAIYDTGHTNSVLIDCAFKRNNGGCTIRGSGDNIMLTGCFFEGNVGDGYGGGIEISRSDANLSDCIFQGNIGSKSGGAVYIDGGSEQFVTLSHCTFIDNSTADHLGFDGGALAHHGEGIAVLKWCKFYGNSATSYGGGIHAPANGKTVLLNCFVEGNTSAHGGGMYISGTGETVLTCCVVSGNRATKYGGGIDINRGYTKIANCTLSNNKAPRGQGLFISGTNTFVDVNNSILWNEGNENYIGTGLSIRYSDVLGGWEGEGNINEDPQFVDPGYWDANGTPEDANDDFWVKGDYHLLAASPCIEAGDTQSVPPDTYDLDEDGDVNEPHPYDLHRRPRIVGTNVEMGAYEYTGPVCGEVDHPYPAMDFNKDCIVNFLDFAMFAKHWMVCTKPECD